MEEEKLRNLQESKGWDWLKQNKKQRKILPLHEKRIYFDCKSTKDIFASFLNVNAFEDVYIFNITELAYILFVSLSCLKWM